MSKDASSKDDRVRPIFVLVIMLLLILVYIGIIRFPAIVIFVSDIKNAPEHGKKVEEKLFESTQEGFLETQQYFLSSTVPEEVINNIVEVQGSYSDFYYQSSIEKNQVLKIHRIYRYEINFGGQMLADTTYRHTCVEYTGRPGPEVVLTQKSVACPTGGDFGTDEGEVSFDYPAEPVH